MSFCALCFISVSVVSVFLEECVKPPEKQDTMTSFYTAGSSKEVMGSSSTLQVISNICTKQNLKHIYVSLLSVLAVLFMLTHLSLLFLVFMVKK